MHSRRAFLSRLACLLSLATASTLLRGQSTEPTLNPLFPLAVEAPFKPTPVNYGGQIVLVYELRLVNLFRSDITVLSIEVRGQSDTEKLAALQGDGLNKVIVRAGADPKSANQSMLPAGSFAVAYLWLTLPAGAPVPTTLRHRLTGRATNPDGTVALRYFDVEPVAVSRTHAIVIGPPFYGAGWVVGFNGPQSPHRRSLRPVFGRLGISQRFAIDWNKFDDKDWHAFRGKGETNEEAYAYGQEVLAVADGTVARVRDGIPQNDPASGKMAVPISFDTVTGNTIALDIGNGAFAHYMHLQPGSIRVRRGDKVRKGDVIALVGNSGNALGPHLHFQVSDSPNAPGGEGLPFEFDRYEQIGVMDMQTLQTGAWAAPPGANWVQHRNEMPVEGAIVRFTLEK